MNTSQRFLLVASCEDRVGIVAAVSKCLAENGCFIDRSRSFGDVETGRFFMRLDFHPTRAGFTRAGFEAEFAETAECFAMEWELSEFERKTRTVILVSKADHCVNALLYAARIGDLPIEPVAVVSNHRDLEGALAHWGVPFHLIPVTAETKPEAESRLFEIIWETTAELVVLARYMQILSADACTRLAGRCINIHHSFLPSFKGTRPYHQAHARGVKMIGASAHYVTTDLDEGPILTQLTEAVDHSHTVAELISIGRHLEATALTRAVKAHAERRTFVNGNKTVVFA